MAMMINLMTFLIHCKTKTKNNNATWKEKSWSWKCQRCAGGFLGVVFVRVRRSFPGKPGTVLNCSKEKAAGRSRRLFNVQCSVFNLCEIRGKIELHCFVSSWAFPGILESHFLCSIAVSVFTLILRQGALSIRQCLTMSLALKGNIEVIRILLKLKREWGKFEMRHGGWRRH